jgi:TonB-linked SusC/RagA family outer membrane protein
MAKTKRMVHRNCLFTQKNYLAVIGMFFSLAVSAQGNSLKIAGRVVDEKSEEPLIGASISLVGGKTGAVTDTDGNFVMRTDSFPVTISVAYLGYRDREITVEKQTVPLVISLVENTNFLEEVVVVGYGAQRRKELTGAVTTVSKELLNQKVTSLDAILGGAVAGLNVTSVSGQPGAGSSIRIRGGNSIHASNEPLYVIDGVIVYPRSTDAGAGSSEVAVESSINPLASINPADIESVSVLKDVSATAIFGSRGANGVIIVTTKKGSRGKDVIHYTVTAGWSTPAKRLDLMNAPQWARLQMDYFGNKGHITGEHLASIGNGYDWQRAVLQTGFTQNHDLSVSGGDEKTRYSISGNFVNQDGVIIHSGFRRYNARVSIDRNVCENLTVGANATFGQSVQNSLTTSKEVNYNSSPFGDGITNSLTYALFMPPTVPVYNADGSFNYRNPWESSHFSLNGRQANPVSDLENSVAESVNNSLLANFYAAYTVFNGLLAKVTLSTDQSSVTQNFFAPSTTALGLNEVGVGSVGKKQHEIWQGDVTVDYSGRVGERHFIHFLCGYTGQEVEENYLINRSSHFTNETLKHNNLGDGEVQTPTVNGVLGSKLHSLITRLNYTLLDKYNVTATFRSDYSDRFAPGKRWGHFPSAGFSWNIDRECLFLI